MGDRKKTFFSATPKKNKKAVRPARLYMYIMCGFMCSLVLYCHGHAGVCVCVCVCVCAHACVSAYICTYVYVRVEALNFTRLVGPDLLKYSIKKVTTILLRKILMQSACRFT